MTIQEIKEKANNDIKRAREGYRDSIISFLEENNLRGEVIRVKDSKVGYLHVQSDYNTRLGYSVYFYPLKKDGTEGQKPVSVWEDNITKDFKSHTNQGEVE